MDKELYDLLDDMTAEELMPAGELLEEMAENTSLPEDTGSRIRASVLKKAGFEMKNTIRMNKVNDNISDIEELNTVRRGHQIIAACAALVLAAGAVGSMIFSSKMNASAPGSEVTEVTETADSSELSESTETSDSTETTESAETSEIAEETESSRTEDSSQPEIVLGELAVIPDVKGMSAEEAEKALSDAGYVPVMRNVFDEAPAGKAVSTSPKAGQKLNKGIEVECRISIGEMNGEPLTLFDLTEEEARAKIEAAGFIPERVEVFSSFYPVGKVCHQESDFCMVASQPLPGTKLKYYVSGSSETTKDIPDFNKVVYEDDKVVITADKMMCDGQYFIMHLTEETKDGTTMREFHEKWGERLRYVKDGERVAYIKGMAEERDSGDSTKGGAYLSWVVDFTVADYELEVDLVALEDNQTYMSETSEGSVKRESFKLDANIPTRTLTSEDGLTITLSPMGISWASKSDDYLDEYPDDPFRTDDEHSGGIFILTKDGRRLRELDYYLSQDLGMSTGRELGACYYAYKDMDEVEAVEVSGVIFK